MQSPKNITVVVEYFPPRLGADRRIFELIRRLSKEYRVNFVIIPPAYTLFIKRIDHKPVRGASFTYNCMVGHQIGLPNWLWKLWEKSFLLAYVLTAPYLFLRILQELVECKSDVVIIKDTSAYAGLIGTLSSGVLRKTSIVDFDDLKSSYTSQLVRGKVKRASYLIGRSLIMVEDFILKHNSKVTALSQPLMNYAAQRGVKNKLFFIPDGVDTSLFDPSKFCGEEARRELGISENTILCIYTGRIDENMGGEILFEAARLLDAEINTIKFLIIGEGDQSLVKRFAKLSNTRLIGRVPAEEIPRYLAAADIVLVPYPNKPASHAASPLKLFEGLAMEKPVIAADVCEIRNIVLGGSNCILVSDDPKEWVFSIGKLARDYDTYMVFSERARKNGRRIVQEKYDWERLAHEFSKVIDND